MIRIVGVHGIRNYESRAASPLAAALAKAGEWRAALLGSPSCPLSSGDFELDVAYYAHLLVQPGRQGSSQLDKDAAELWQRFVSDYLPPNPQGTLRSTLHTASARLARAFGQNEKLTVALLERFFREVAVFLRTDGDFSPKAEVLKTVGTAVQGADVVVAHSLGSIVAYEALWKHRVELPLLVTIGSPLAMPMVFLA
nr:hypothetical protein GCM10025732_07140 [Glycomyces mayteni]